MTHLASAKSSCIARVEAWAGNNEDEKSSCLEREFEASLQATMAAAIALDAFYSVIQTHVQLPTSLVERWRTKRASRYSQVTEVLRRGFHLKPQETKVLRQNVKEIYRFRDLAVHPSGKLQAPLLHPELNVGVEWRFAYFRAARAEMLVNASIAIIQELVNNGKPTEVAIIRYAQGLRDRLLHLA